MGIEQHLDKSPWEEEDKRSEEPLSHAELADSLGLPPNATLEDIQNARRLAEGKISQTELKRRRFGKGNKEAA